MRTPPILSIAIPLLSLTCCAAQTVDREPGTEDPNDSSRSRVMTFPDADSLKSWSFSNGPEWPGATGRLAWHADAGREHDGAAALSYNFEKGGNYVAAIVPLPPSPAVKAVRLWVHKPTANLMIFRAVDADGEAFQKNVRYHYPGWQQLEITIGGWGFSWGGDGTFRNPPREFHILIENDGGTRAGTVLLDDLQWVYEMDPDSPTGDAQTTYVESDFTDTGHWRYEGSPGGGFDENRSWKYEFDDDHTSTNLVRDRGILGRPQRMLVRITGDASGHELFATIGSHFQNFERSLGTIDQTGPMTLDVPLGDMKSWRHFGGEDDGIVRYPLRLIGLSLRKKTETERGSLRMMELAFDTAYRPDSETVALIPTVSTSGDTPRFSVELRSLAEQTLTGRLHWSLHQTDRLLRGGSQPVTLSPRGKPTFTEIEGEWANGNVAEGRFRFRADNGVESPEASTTVARAPRGDVDLALNPASRMGVGMYLYRFHGHPEAKLWMGRMCDLAARAGVKWTREEFHWNWIEPARGQTDFTFFDQLVDTAHEHGISVYALCCYWTTWTKPYTDEGIEDYCRYLETLVRRYGDRIKHWEIWNEPNVFFWSGPKETYVKLLKRAYETIKAIDPDAQVLGCSTAGIDTSFIKMVLDADGPFDALTVHPYRGSLDPDRFISELRNTRKLASGRDVWITEMGWPSHIGGLAERTQAQHVARTYICALASGAARSVAWYDFREDGADPFFNEHHFGLIRHDLTPKIGYLSLATVGRLIGTAEFEQELDVGPGLVGFRFRNGEQSIAALWSTGASKLVRLTTGAQSARFINMTGGPALTAPLQGSTIMLLERDTPTYVVAEGPLKLEIGDAPARITPAQPAVHPGDEVSVRFASDEGVLIDLQPPPGWQVEPLKSGNELRYTVPRRVPAGRRQLLGNVTIGDAVFVLPVEIEIVPQIVRG